MAARPRVLRSASPYRGPRRRSCGRLGRSCGLARTQGAPPSPSHRCGAIDRKRVCTDPVQDVLWCTTKVNRTIYDVDRSTCTRATLHRLWCDLLRFHVQCLTPDVRLISPIRASRHDVCAAMKPPQRTSRAAPLRPSAHSAASEPTAPRDSPTSSLPPENASAGRGAPPFHPPSPSKLPAPPPSSPRTPASRARSRRRTPVCSA